MNNLILQPAGNADAREHYLDTVQVTVSLDAVKHHLTAGQTARINEVYPSGLFRCWGGHSIKNEILESGKEFKLVM